MFLRIESAVRKSVTSVTRWLITPHPADLSRVMHQRLVQEYVPFAAPSLNSHSADLAVNRVAKLWSILHKFSLNLISPWSSPK